MKVYSLAILTLCALVSASIAVAVDDTETKTGTSPGSVRVSDPVSGDWLVTAGLTACQNVSSSGPGHCASAGAGGVIFDISHLNFDEKNNLAKTQHVIQGQITVTTITCNPCGYKNITAGNDRDDDGIVTNVDAVDDDAGSSDHGWSRPYDDQRAHCVIDKPKGPGDSCVIKFCFADDAITHDWDTIAVFIATDPLNPNVGSVQITRHDLSGNSQGPNGEPWGHVGDNMSDCTASYREAVR